MEKRPIFAMTTDRSKVGDYRASKSSHATLQNNNLWCCVGCTLRVDPLGSIDNRRFQINSFLTDKNCDCDADVVPKKTEPPTPQDSCGIENRNCDAQGDRLMRCQSQTPEGLANDSVVNSPLKKNKSDVACQECLNRFVKLCLPFVIRVIDS